MSKKVFLATGIILFGIVCIAGADEAKENLYAFSIDAGASIIMPMGEYGHFTNAGAGGNLRFNVSPPKTDFEFSLHIGSHWLNSASPYVDTLADVLLLIEAAYPFLMGTNGMAFMPRLSAGLLIHMTTGEFNTLTNDNQAAYFDQYYGISGEVAFEPWNGSNPKAQLGFYVAPGFFVFPNHEYWGLRAGLALGARVRLGTAPTTSNTNSQ